MNDLKIIRYELKRLIFSKYYVFLLLITGLFAYYILSQKVILGTAYTAPFSNWSYTTFLCDMLPYFLVILLFFCTYVVSRKELRVRTLTLSTPLAVTRYYLFKAVAILSSVFFTVFLIIGLSFGFYALVFDYSCFAGFFTPIILFVIPPLFFVFGLGMLLGSLNEIFLYILIPLMFLFGNLSFPLPIWLDLFGRVIPQTYPYSLQTGADGDIPFMLPPGFWQSRVLWVFSGLVLFGLMCFLENKKIQLRNGE